MKAVPDLPNEYEFFGDEFEGSKNIEIREKPYSRPEINLAWLVILVIFIMTLFSMYLMVFYPGEASRAIFEFIKTMDMVVISIVLVGIYKYKGKSTK